MLQLLQPEPERLKLSTPRIIAGKAKGAHLRDVPGDSTRPITDRVKEALFNIIGSDIVDSVFLDLFGGTGSVGIEAISRGAKSVLFIENNHNAYKTIIDNLASTRLADKAAVKLMDAYTFLQHPTQKPFTYIFIAPPQYKKMWEKSIKLVDQHPDYLEDDGSLIVQIDPIEYVELDLEHFREYESRKYGSTLLVFYEKVI